MDQNNSVQKTVKGMNIEAPFFDSVESLIESAKPQGVFACVPPAFNLSIAEKCISKNVSLFIEKPMAQNLHDAKKMAQLLDASNPKPSNAVGYMVAYYPTFRQAKKLLDEKAVGEIRHYSSSLLLGEVFKKQEGWRQNPKISGGGAVAVLGSHMLYLLQSLVGVPSEVRANSFKFFSDVEDSCQARLEHGGFCGEFYVSWSRPGYAEMGMQIQIEGTQGYLEVTENSVSLFAFEGHPKHPPGWKAWYPWDLADQGKVPTEVQVGQQGFTAQDYDFVSSLGTGKQPLVNWSEGLKVQRVIETIYLSAANSGQPTRVPD